MKWKKSKINMLLLGMVLALGIFSYSWASNNYLATFNNTNGTTYDCGVCHTTASGSSSARNSFGADWASTTYGNHSYTITTALANRDSDGDGVTNGAEIQAKTNPGNADNTLPVFNGFTLPTTSTSLTVPISGVSATDNVGVTGYLFNESSVKPGANVTGWSAAPTSYAFPSAGTRTLYAWARDAAGNVSNSLSRSVTITTTGTGPDTTRPVVGGFTIPATSSSLTVPISSVSASDNVLVTGYLFTETSGVPALNAAGWSGTTPPSSYIFATAGAKTLYGWARDGAGNVSNNVVSRTVTITTTPGGGTGTLPAITDFRIPFSSTSWTVPILAFTANSAVTGYLVTEMTPPVIPPAPNAAGWRTTPPTTYTFSSSGLKALYAWARDGSGHIAEPWSEMVQITTNDVTPPQVMEFSTARTSNSSTLSILGFKAVDDVGVTGYLITTSSTKPSASTSGWRTTPPTSYSVSSGGANTLYGWAKDAAGNVSNGLSDSVSGTTTTSDSAPPVVTAFSVPSSSNSLTVPIRTFTATDNVAVTGYMVTTSSTRPGASSSSWRSTPPTSYTFTSGGTKRLYPWAKDRAGNVSALANYASVNITTGSGGNDD